MNHQSGRNNYIGTNGPKRAAQFTAVQARINLSLRHTNTGFGQLCNTELTQLCDRFKSLAFTVFHRPHRTERNKQVAALVADGNIDNHAIVAGCYPLHCAHECIQPCISIGAFVVQLELDKHSGNRFKSTDIHFSTTAEPARNGIMHPRQQCALADYLRWCPGVLWNVVINFAQRGVTCSAAGCIVKTRNTGQIGNHASGHQQLISSSQITCLGHLRYDRSSEHLETLNGVITNDKALCSARGHCHPHGNIKFAYTGNNNGRQTIDGSEHGCTGSRCA